jgi:hypothetical protein
MTKYLMSCHYPQGRTQPEPEELARIGKDLDALNGELKAAGSFVFAGGLHDASTATVVQDVGGEIVTTDGPWAETKEHLGGLSIIDVADLDAALAAAARLSTASTLPIEVRPFLEDPR